MKTLLKMNDKTIGKVGPQILKPGVKEKENPRENWGPYNILLRAQPPSSHLRVPRERKGKMVSGGGGSSVHYDQRQ